MAINTANPTDAQIVQRLMELGRKDVLTVMTNYPKRLNWYKTHGVREYPDFWTATRADQINTNNPASNTPKTSLASQLVAGAGKAPTVPVFSEVLPQEKGWGMMQPAVQEEAYQQVNPSINRDLNTQMRNLNLNLASTGAGRFSRALGQQGTLGAQAEQNRKAQVMDWMNAREGQFNEWYNQTQDAWTKGMTQGKTQAELQGQYKIPTTYADFLNNTNATTPNVATGFTGQNLLKLS